MKIFIMIHIPEKKINNQGFAIPQILILGIGIAIGVTGLISSSNLSLSGSRINKQRIISKSCFIFWYYEIKSFI